MRLNELTVGQFCTRADWAAKNYGDPLVIKCNGNQSYIYVNSNTVIPNTSRVLQYTDYYLCTENGTPANTRNTAQGAFLTRAFAVYSTRSGLSGFDTMAEVEEFISIELQSKPDTKFKIFKLYAIVEPKIQRLQDMIRLVDESTE